MNEDKKLFQNLTRPFLAPKIKKSNLTKKNDREIIKIDENEISDAGIVRQAAKDSVRAIMLIRAYRIRGHLQASLDPLEIQTKKDHPELNPEMYGFGKNDYDRKIFLDGVLGLQNASLREIISILKKPTVQKIDMNLCTWRPLTKKLG